MNKIILTINLVDGTSFLVETCAGDIVKWEAKFDLGIDKLEKITHLLYLAWLAVVRLKKTGASFDEWIDLVGDVQVSDPKESTV